jgi:peptidoglycan/LPS O-acetylase OafA/YrhL
MPPTPTALPLDEGKRLPALDGLRGLAVLLVLLDHASDAHLRIFPAANMNRAGKYGVYLFFVLSAFLLTHLLLLRPAAELARARTWINYAVRRFLRIFPLFALVLAVLVIIHRLKWHDFFTHILLRDGKRQFWTIPVEVKYYMILPLVAVTLSWLRERRWLGGLLAGMGAIAVGALVLYAEGLWSISKPVLLSQYLEPFLLGTIAALAHQAMAKRPVGTARFAVWFEVVAFAALAASIVHIPSIYNAIFTPHHVVKKFGYESAVCGVFWTLVLLGMLHGTGWMRRLFELAPIRYLGLISYSVYLWHVKFLSDVDDMKWPKILTGGVRTILPSPLRLVIFIVIVVGVATISYFLIERPLSRLRFTRSGLRAGEPTLPSPAVIG